MEPAMGLLFFIVFVLKVLSKWEKFERREEILDENDRLKEQLQKQQSQNEVSKNSPSTTREVIITMKIDE